MDKARLRKLAVEPANKLWDMFWSHFVWEEQTDEWWEQTTNEFVSMADEYKRTKSGYLVAELAMAYLKTLQWCASGGKRKYPTTINFLGQKSREEAKALVDGAKAGDEVSVLADGKKQVVKIT